MKDEAIKKGGKIQKKALMLFKRDFVRAVKFYDFIPNRNIKWLTRFNF